ncbi:MAG: SUF system NifU family Fe-S cluster assembly protein [Planctomycetota bacterium]|nr:SUF system NifU family Fe-S cluster assembly protein [Planctomycetota bacterium]
MADLDELYQEVIFDHSKKPRNCRKLEHPTCDAGGHNPLCGDRIHVYLELDGETIKDVAFEGKGCAISTASASMMTAAVKGKTRAEARALASDFVGMVTDAPAAAELSERLGKLNVFSGVKKFPVRVKCASLAWRTLEAALDERQTEVSTE